MTPENFCYWLQGLFELSEIDANKRNVNNTLSVEQVKCIREHLEYVFKSTVVIQQKSPGAGGAPGSGTFKYRERPFLGGLIC